MILFFLHVNPMRDEDPIDSIGRNWNRVLYLCDIGLLPLAQLPFGLETKTINNGN